MWFLRFFGDVRKSCDILWQVFLVTYVILFSSSFIFKKQLNSKNMFGTWTLFDDLSLLATLATYVLPVSCFTVYLYCFLRLLLRCFFFLVCLKLTLIFCCFKIFCDMFVGPCNDFFSYPAITMWCSFTCAFSMGTLPLGILCNKCTFLYRIC